MFFLFLFLFIFATESRGKLITFDLNLWEESYNEVKISLDFTGDFWSSRTYSINFETKKKDEVTSKNLPKQGKKLYTEFRSPDGKRTGIRMMCSAGSVCWFVSFQGGLLHQISKFHRSGVSVHEKDPWQIIQFDQRARMAHIQTKVLNIFTKKVYLYEGDFLKGINFFVENTLIIQEKISHQGKNQVRREILQRDYINGNLESKGSVVTKMTHGGEKIHFYYDAQGNFLQSKKTDMQGNKPTKVHDSVGKEIFYGYSPVHTMRQQQVEMTKKVESITSRTALLLEEESWDFESFSECDVKECVTSSGETIRFFSPSYEQWVTTWGGDEREKTTLYTPTSVEKIYENHKKILTYEDDGSTVFKRFFYPYNTFHGQVKTIWSTDGLPLEEIYEKSRNLYFYGERPQLKSSSKKNLERMFVLDRVEMYEILQQFLQEKPYPKEKIAPFLGHLKKFIEVNHKKQISLGENGRVIKYSRWEIGEKTQTGLSLSVKFYVGEASIKYYKSRSLLDFVEDGILLTKVDNTPAHNKVPLYGGWNEFLTREEDRVDPDLENLSTKVYIRVDRNLLEELTITRYTPDGLIYAEKKVTRSNGVQLKNGSPNGMTVKENVVMDKFFSTFEDAVEPRVQSTGL